jgi:hypothetical protein
MLSSGDVGLFVTEVTTVQKIVGVTVSIRNGVDVFWKLEMV